MPRPPQTRLALVALGVAALAALALAVTVLVGGAGDTAGATPAEQAQGAVPRDGFAGSVMPDRPTPPLALRDAAGRRVDLAAMRGDAVFVTFLYTDCPDICPLTTDHLREAIDGLAPAVRRRVRVVAVSVDPAGDTPAAVRAFLARHRMTGRMSYLVGSAAELTPTWRAWGVAAVTDAGSGAVTHSALIYGVDAAGRLRTVYPWSAPVADLAHDAPRLVDAS